MLYNIFQAVYNLDKGLCLAREMDFHSLEPAQRVKGARPLSVDGSLRKQESLKQVGGHPLMWDTGSAECS